MPIRSLPVVPRLDQLKHQAKDWLRALHAGDAAAIAELREFHPDAIEPSAAKLADAQYVLARSYEASSWTRLVQAVQIVDAIWRDDIDALRKLVTRNPHLIHESTLIRKNSNWGPPLSYAANIGRDRIIQMLHAKGATDLTYALDRATLQGKIGTARMLHAMLGAPPPPRGALEGAAYTLSAEGTALQIELGAKVITPDGVRIAPVSMVIESDSRKPNAKHAILEMYVQHGLVLPHTPTMALHRGRIDLLEQLLETDPSAINRTYTHREIFPHEMGCREEANASVGTPLGGTTLLHMCVDFDEMDIARWLLERGADVNARSSTDSYGFGGYTALFNAVVSQPNYWANRYGRTPGSARFAQLLLEHGANSDVRANIRKEMHPDYEGPKLHELRDVTAVAWGQQFPDALWVSADAIQLIRDAGGTV